MRGLPGDQRVGMWNTQCLYLQLGGFSDKRPRHQCSHELKAWHHVSSRKNLRSRSRVYNRMRLKNTDYFLLRELLRLKAGASPMVMASGDRAMGAWWGRGEPHFHHLLGKNIWFCSPWRPSRHPKRVLDLSHLERGCTRKASHTGEKERCQGWKGSEREKQKEQT